MMTGKVTTVHAGDTIMVEFDETIHHPGWFRISLVEKREDLKDPDFPNADCTVDMSKVPKGAHDNALVDGLGMDTDLFGQNRQFKEMVKLPNKPCEKCTLQVIQVMADTAHRPPGCVYHHCADLKILPAGSDTSGSAGTGGQASGGTSGNLSQTPAAGSAGTAGARVPEAGSGVAAASAGATATSSAVGKTATAGTQAAGGTTALSSNQSPVIAGGAPSIPPSGGSASSATSNNAPATTTSKGGSCSIVVGAGAASDRALPMAALLGLSLVLLRRRRTRV